MSSNKEVPLIDADGDGYVDLPPLESLVIPKRLSSAQIENLDRMINGEDEELSE